MLEYFLLSLFLILISILLTFVFHNIFHIKVFGGSIVMFIVSVIGSLLGIYYLPEIKYILPNKVDVSDAITGAFILILFLYIVTPKVLK